MIIDLTGSGRSTVPPPEVDGTACPDHIDLTICEPVLEGLQRMGVDAAFAGSEQPSIHYPSCYLRDINPAHDVVAPAEGGEPGKISGNAQYRQRDVVIQHGSISYALEPDHHVGVFDVDLEPATFTDRVTSIREQVGIDREEAVETLGAALREWCDADDGGWRAAELEAARELTDHKYGAESWIRDREALEVTR